MNNTQSLWIPAVLPGQNAIIDACKNIKIVKGWGSRKKVWSAYAQLKARWTDFIVACVRSDGEPIVPRISAHFTYVVAEPSRRRDPSNAGMGAIKFIEDALQVAGVIPNDGWENVLSISLTFLHSPITPGVLVILSDERLSEGEALKIYGEKAICSTTNELKLAAAQLMAKKQPRRQRKTPAARGRFAKRSR